MEFVSAIVGPVVKLLAEHITQKLRNLTSSADRVKEMKDKMKVLDSQRVDNEKRLRRNGENNLEIPDRVDGWLKEAKKIKEDVENDGCFDLEKKMRRNSENNREIPDRVRDSLEEVEKIKEDADNIPTNNNGCFNIKKKYLAGRNALMHIKDIDRLIKESSDMIWSDAPIGFGRVNSKRLASTSGGGTQNLFKSRDKTFNDALKLLQQNDDDDDAARVIALCGMGGVGKTTLMNDLKKVATDKKMFNWISVAVIGNAPNLLAIQKNIALQTGKPLTETDETLMATYLSKRFEEFSERKEKILVILDDVWKKIKLKDIGLASPLPKGVKLLLTSRYADICHQIAVDAGSVLQAVRVDVLEEEEARDFFCQITKISAEHDRDLYEKGCIIVKKCGYLPLAIKLIAATLYSKDEYLWRRTLKRLKKNDLDENVQKIINISYESLVHDDKAIFQLCGLFPEDSNIPIEDLTRYAWGLELLKEDSSMKDARDSTQTSVSNLKNAYLLMNGDSRHSDCVKLHDLVLAFVVGAVSKGGKDGCRIMQHDDFSKLSEANNMSQSCKQLSLTCKGMSEFPSEFQFLNLSLLKLMHGDESLRPQDFYATMKKLQVIALDRMEYAFVPTSFQCSTYLRTLCLDGCSLMFDLTCLGNLSNLEVLSFANSGITILPSTFGNLQDATPKLEKVVLVDMQNLKEIWPPQFSICNLCPLRELMVKGCGSIEVLFNMDFGKIKQFSSSLRSITVSKCNSLVKLFSCNPFPFLNNLQEFNVESCRSIQVLFNTDLGRAGKSQEQVYSSSLRSIKVSRCDSLVNLLPSNPMPLFNHLEELEVRWRACVEVIFDMDMGCVGEMDKVSSSRLRSIYLERLGKLREVWRIKDAGNNLIHGFEAVESIRIEDCERSENLITPATTNLDMRALKEVKLINYGRKRERSYEVKQIDGCGRESGRNQDQQINVIPTSREEVNDGISKVALPSSLLPTFHHLHELVLRDYKDVEVVFEITTPSSRESPHSTQQPPVLPYLKKLKLEDMGRMSHVWKCDWNEFLILHKPQSQSSFHNLTTITMEDCHSIKYLFSPLMAKLLSNLKKVDIWRCDGIEEVVLNRDQSTDSLKNTSLFLHLDILELYSLEKLKCIGGSANSISTDIHDELKLSSWSLCQYAREINIRCCDALSSVVPWYAAGQMQKLQVLKIKDCKSMTEVFETQ